MQAISEGGGCTGAPAAPLRCCGGRAVVGVLAMVMLLAYGVDRATAAAGAGAAAARQDAADAGEIELRFPENTELVTLLGFVSQRLHINLVYDETQVSQRVTLRTPAAVPESALLDVLRAVLHAKNLALEETEVQGLLRVVPVQELDHVAQLDGRGMGDAVTEVIQLAHSSTDRILPVVQPLLSNPGGSITVSPDAGLLILTDFRDRVGKIRNVIERLDIDRGRPMVRSVEVGGDASELLRVLQPVLQATERLGPAAAGKAAVSLDPRRNALIVAGGPDAVEATIEVIESLARDRAAERRVYRLDYLPVDRLDWFIRQLICPGGGESGYRAAADPNARVLVVTASPAVHEQIASLVADLDVPPETTASPVRFYKLTNTLAKHVLATLRELEGESGLAASDVRDEEDSARGDWPQLPRALQTSLRPEAGVEEAASPEASIADRNQSVSAGNSTGQADETIRGAAAPARGRPTLAMDENTNSIIVIAPPAQQRLYAEVIKALDERRPQVLVEATIATLDTTDGFTLGVDIATAQDTGNGKIISFSAFGVSQLSPDTGSLLPIAASGGTFALLSPDVADVVIRALATNNRSKLSSIPRVLVNDNQEAHLRSENEVPYQQSVAPSDNFVFSGADYATAGTTISVTPHVSKGDYLQLEYSVRLSSFTAAPPSEGLPPPRLSNEIESDVTIPDGYTIVVGGLNTSNVTKTIQKIPLLGDIPVIQNLFRSQTTSSSNTTLFVFIRPRILRDDAFRDLKRLSRLDREAAGLDPAYPVSQPLLMEPGVLKPSDGAGSSSTEAQ